MKILLQSIHLFLIQTGMKAMMLSKSVTVTAYWNSTPA